MVWRSSKRPRTPVSKRVRFVVEYGWRIRLGRHGLLFKHVGLPEPDFWLFADAEFPINGKEHLRLTFILEMTTQEVPIFIALWRPSRKHGTRSATAVVSGQLPGIFGLLDAFAENTSSVWNLNCQWRNLYRFTIAGNLLTDQLLKDGINGARPVLGSLVGNNLILSIGAAEAYLHIWQLHFFTKILLVKIGVLPMQMPRWDHWAWMQGCSILMTFKANNTIAFSISVTLKVQILKPSSPPLKDRRVATVSLSFHGHTPHYVSMDDEGGIHSLACLRKTNWPQGHEQVIPVVYLWSSLER